MSVRMMEVRNNINVHIFRSLSTTIAAWSMVPLTVLNVVSTTGFGFRSVEGISQSASMIMWWGSGIIAAARYKKTSMHARWLALDYEWKKIRDQVDDGDNIDIRTLKVFWIVLRFAYMVFDNMNLSCPSKREASRRDGLTTRPRTGPDLMFRESSLNAQVWVRSVKSIDWV